MVQGILAKKIGMMQVFSDHGDLVPVTVVQAGPCVVVLRRSAERDGHEAVQLGFVDGKPPRKVSKSLSTTFAKAGVPPDARHPGVRRRRGLGSQARRHRAV